MKRGAAALAGVLLLSGCSGVYNLPLPGGANLGGHPYEVTAQFTNALDLVPQSGVKVNHVAVGKVTKISLSADGRTAVVRMKINGNVKLPANAIATIDQTSLLGEKYVALAPPTQVHAAGTLRDGAVIKVGDTSQSVELEQVFGALSLLLNGGGLSQLHDIANELNKASTGNESEIRDFLSTVNQVVTEMNTHRDSITSALDGLDALSKTLKKDQGKITNVLDNLSGGLKVLNSQRSQLVAMLNALNRLSSTTVRTLNASQADMVADLNQIAPILKQLAAAGTALPQSLEILLTYPFPVSVLPAIKGDYLNAFVTTALNTQCDTTTFCGGAPGTTRLA